MELKIDPVNSFRIKHGPALDRCATYNLKVRLLLHPAKVRLVLWLI